MKAVQKNISQEWPGCKTDVSWGEIAPDSGLIFSYSKAGFMQDIKTSIKVTCSTQARLIPGDSTNEVFYKDLKITITIV